MRKKAEIYWIFDENVEQPVDSLRQIRLFREGQHEPTQTPTQRPIAIKRTARSRISENKKRQTKLILAGRDLAPQCTLPFRVWTLRLQNSISEMASWVSKIWQSQETVCTVDQREKKSCHNTGDRTHAASLEKQLRLACWRVGKEKSWRYPALSSNLYRPFTDPLQTHQ